MRRASPRATAAPLDRATVRRTLRSARARLLDLPNVRFLAVGYKKTAGARRPVLAIRVFVRAKRDVPAVDRIPRRIRAVGRNGRRLARFVPTDVERTGGAYRGLAPAGGAALVGHRRGSLGLAYRTPAGRRLVLTNSHVVARVDRPAFGRPVEVRTGGGLQTLGVVHRMRVLESARDNEHDAALVTAAIAVDELAVGGPAPLRIAAVAALGRQPRTFYVSHGRRVTCASPEQVETPVDVEVAPDTVVRFARCFRLDVVHGEPAEGHSGSVLLAQRAEGAIACGLLFAGNRESILATSLPATLRALSAAGASADGAEEDVGIALGGPPAIALRAVP